MTHNGVRLFFLMHTQSCQKQLPTWYLCKGTLLWCNPQGLSKLHSGVPDFFPAAIHQLVGGNVVPYCLAFLPPTMMATVPSASQHRASPNTVYMHSVVRYAGIQTAVPCAPAHQYLQLLSEGI